MEDTQDLKLFTFFRLDDNENKGPAGSAPTLSTATIMAKYYEEALQLCKKQFEPETYHEIELKTVADLARHYQFVKYPKPIMLRNNDDLKDLS